jgi:hypothetical protein
MEIVVSTRQCRRLSPLRVSNNIDYPSLVLVVDPSPRLDAGSYVTSPTCVHAKNPRRLGVEGNKSVRSRKILDVDGEGTEVSKVNYLWRFISNLAGKIDAFTPILRLKNDVKFTWGQNSRKCLTSLESICLWLPC